MPRCILHVVSNVAHFDHPDEPTGLWLSELSHAYDLFAAQGYEQRLVSPKGGAIPLEPRSLKWPNADASTKRWLAAPASMALLSDTASPGELHGKDFDAIYFTGCHAVMYDFPDDEGLRRLTREVYESGGIVDSVCHGYCGLLNTRLSDGSLLVVGRRVTGFTWMEEILAGVAKQAPYDAEEEMRRRGARFEKSLQSQSGVILASRSGRRMKQRPLQLHVCRRRASIYT
ncbi:type 1 glutamine amidotransferase domain-containing protein [Pseudomonas sp. PDM19]|uniref:type 1 glutamine amidotransferase domain-containing protein n=1 Tax=Pseudomonas sp. PDM19 TaxID=2769272 RepID=UPI00178636CC|nr:type 1 glutamine amidotransferase domain-containing protein [Pseudomonas sp. PDM19]MBD9630006.1 type 1 glutamine amidotransferase domain-containing protein [Pseudomonas sp. PDM19]